MAENPFQDYHQQPLDANPFADPSIQGALGSTRKTEGDDGYDLESGASSFKQPGESQTSIPQVSYSGGGVRTDATAARWEDLQQREADLSRRETQLNQREEHIRKHGRNNWPPFYPLIYHDIESEIPEEYKKTVTTLYRTWLWLVIAFGVNFVGCLMLLITGQPDGGADLGSSIGYIIVILPLSFLLWYRPFYNGYMKEHALYYYFYFVFGGFHLAYCAYMIIGIPATGSAGLINTIRAFADPSIVTGVFGALSTVAWGMEFLGCAWIYRITWIHKKEKGHTFDQAKREMGEHGLRAYFFGGR